jgi:hypothetical protein
VSVLWVIFSAFIAAVSDLPGYYVCETLDCSRARAVQGSVPALS